MKKIIICLFLSAGLSGCHVYRTYERPDTTVTDSLYRQPVVAGDTASIASLSWKELFSDPQLQQLIETGIANNTDLNIARLKVKEVEALQVGLSAFCIAHSARNIEQRGWFENFQDL